MFENIYGGGPRVNAAYFIVTEQCNLRCKYCYETHGTKRMSRDVAFAGVDFLFEDSKNYPEIDITFFGGEPTLESDLICETVDYAVKLNKKYMRNLQFMIVTNCITLPDSLCNTIKKLESNTQFHVQLSIDGYGESQDMYRVFPNGSGSWDTVSVTLDKWIDLYKGLKYNGLSVHGCLNKKTLPNLYKNYLYFRETKGIKKLWYIPVSEENWDEDDVNIYRDQLFLIKDHIIDICERDGNTTEIEYYAPLDRCLSNHGPRAKPCGAGMSFVSISPEGSINPCHQIHFNVPNSSIGDIWKGIDDDKRRIFLEYDDSDFPCSTNKCEHNTCFRCLAHNYDARGCMFSIPSNMYCKLMKVDLEVQNILKKYLEQKEKFVS